ncbi:MAG: hypothetical protein ACOZQL_01260 [Myxococcota bacterium]
MKNLVTAGLVSFTLSFALAAFARPAAPPPAPDTELSCKAAGQKCTDKEDCCSRMCRKDNGRCA